MHTGICEECFSLYPVDATRTPQTKRLHTCDDEACLGYVNVCIKAEVQEFIAQIEAERQLTT
jgi:hypothetical protein